MDEPAAKHAAPKRRRFRYSLRAFLLASALLALALGQGGGWIKDLLARPVPPPPGRIVGRLTSQGRPVPDTRILFAAPEKGILIVPTTDRDGYFEFGPRCSLYLASADYSVCVAPPSLQATAPRSIPAKYRDAKTSGLSLRMTREMSRTGVRFDIDLKQ